MTSPETQSVVNRDVLPGGLLAGVAYLVRSLRLFSQRPGLLGYIVVPIGLNVIVGIGLYLSILLPGWQGIDALVANLPAWAGFLDWVLRILLAGGLLIVTGFLMVQFGVILGAPWYGQLAEQLETLQQVELPPSEPLRLGAIGRDLWRAVLYEVKKLLLWLVVASLLLILGVVLPGIGTTIATIGGVALSVLIVCMDFFDAPLERRRWSFRAKLSNVFRTLPASASFGLVCLGLVSIPLLNLLTVPLCMTAGTLFICDRVLAKQTLTS